MVGLQQEEEGLALPEEVAQFWPRMVEKAVVLLVAGSRSG